MIAHEYGHHVQNLLGTNAASAGPVDGSDESASVRLELQADCYAGVWAAHAVDTGSSSSSPTTTSPTGSTPRRRSATTASSSRRQGRVDPEAWTHGSSEQRQRWFTTRLHLRRPEPV